MGLNKTWGAVRYSRKMVLLAVAAGFALGVAVTFMAHSLVSPSLQPRKTLARIQPGREFVFCRYDVSDLLPLFDIPVVLNCAPNNSAQNPMGSSNTDNLLDFIFQTIPFKSWETFHRAIPDMGFACSSADQIFVVQSPKNQSEIRRILQELRLYATSPGLGHSLIP